METKEFDKVANKLEVELGIYDYKYKAKYNHYLWAIIGGALSYSKEQGKTIDEVIELCAKRLEEYSK